MSKWDHVHRQARAFHREICQFSDDQVTECPVGAKAEILLAKAERLTGISREGYPKGHPLLGHADARCDGEVIIYDSSVDPQVSLYYQAHEYAHVGLGHGARNCEAADLDGEMTEDKLPLGVHRVEGYGPQERIECEANIFAREFLLPGDVLRRWFNADHLSAEQIAERTGISIELVCHQLAQALLTPDVESRTRKYDAAPEDNPLKLDDSQRDAAQAPTGPLLIAAGPGTGKTRTLAGRVVYLLSREVEKVAPEAILVLTFSNKAAEELRERVRLVAPEAAAHITVATFHSFGLELLHKYGERLDLPSKPAVLDPVDALFLLESALPELGLDHYQNLYEPTRFLDHMLKAISRAKDENVTPVGYEELALQMSQQATSPEQQVVAEMALEVARVYRVYQQRLAKAGQLDFGDLICRSIELLRTHADVKKEVRGIYQHVLVDEYQDVNRASGLFLKELVGDGAGLWAVGDVRQSIHRWRGATTANMVRFSDDYPLAREPLSLQVNYRSQPPIVDLFAELVPHMRATRGVPFTPWQKDRAEDGGTVRYEIAEDLQAEAQGMARRIEELHKAGIPYREQAVICRSHTSLARLAQGLERAGVPVLYLGDFFERPEVRDMLALLSLACEPDGRGLVRVARFAEYEIPQADVTALRKLASARGVPFPQALGLASECDKIQPTSQAKFAQLAQQLEELCHGRSAWKTLTRYLFVRSRYLQPLLADVSVAGQQRRLALYQLLQFVHSQLGRPEVPGVEPKRACLRYVRRLEIYGEEKQLRQVPAWADGIDAVRMLTIHASKGLEFSAVFLPVLTTYYFPSTNRGYQPCPPPPGLVAGEADGWEAEEEECLFFVALSRARDHLCLSRAKRVLNTNRNPSSFLGHIANRLPRAVNGSVTWPLGGDSPRESAAPVLSLAADSAQVFEERQLGVYLTCPRKYFYEFVLSLNGKRDDAAYLQFHKCVYSVLRRVQEARIAGQPMSEVDALARLDEVWQKGGPVGHPYETLYREQAGRLIANALQQIPLPKARMAATSHELQLAHGRVRLTLDYAEVTEDGAELHVQRLRTGRPPKKELDKPIYGLYHKAAELAHPQARRRRLEIYYLSTKETEEIVLPDEKVGKHLQKYDDAIAGILSERFAPKPDEHECSRCPHLFICPVAE